MIEVALVLALMLPAFLMAYIGLNLGDQHQVMSFFLIMMSLVMTVGVPFTAYKVAVESQDPFPFVKDINQTNTESREYLKSINDRDERSVGLFGGVDVNNRQTLFHIEPTVPLNDRRNDWTGNVTWSGSTYDLTGTSLLKSNQRGEYQPGSTAQVGQMVIVEDKPEGSDNVKWQYFNGEDGFYYGVNSSCTYVGIQKNGEVLSEVCQSNWNVNTVDSETKTESNPSGFKLDLNDANMYQTNFAWYGGGVIEMQVIFDDERRQDTVTLHRFDIDNQTSLSEVSLPVKAQIFNDSDDSTSIRVGGRQYSILDNYEKTARSVKLFRESMTASSTEYTPALSIRPKPGFENVNIDLLSFSATPSCGVNALVRFDTVLTGANFQQPSLVNGNETLLQVDSSATSWQNGTGSFTGEYLDFAQLDGGQNQNKPAAQVESEEVSTVVGDNEIVTLAFKADGNSCEVTDITLQAEEDY